MLEVHSDANFNYQLNRAVYLGGARVEDVERIAPDIHTCADWKRKFVELGEAAEKRGEAALAATYYRMGEFFLFDGDPEKLKYYELSTELFYRAREDVLRRGEVVRESVPFEGCELPVLCRRAMKDGGGRGAVLIHGGNDSYLEEFWDLLFPFSEAGYDAYVFEGPGQGGVLRRQGAKFIPQWERPVRAVLDRFSLENVTIVGASLGGMLAQRAAAFEKRIARVVAWPAFISLQDVMISCRPPKVQRAMRFFLKHDLAGIYDRMIEKKIAAGDAFLEWAMKHGMYAYGAATPFEYLKRAADFQIRDVLGEITQDVLLLGAREDHMVSSRFVGEELELLTAAHSVTARILSEKENAGIHCNADNTALACAAILAWMRQLDEESGKERHHDSVVFQFNW